MNTRLARLVGAAAVVAVLATACGGGDDDATNATGDRGPTTTADSMAPHADTAASTDAGAATLRAGLTALLQEHVYLAGITTGTALDGGDYKVPAAVLDENSQALAKAVGGVYGDAAGTQFLELWRKHIGFFVDYTTAAGAGDAAGKQKALAALDGYRNDFGAFISAANPKLPKAAVAEELKPHIQTLAAAIDAQAAKSPDAYAKLQQAASHMPMTAAVLAGGIVAQYPDKFDGDAAGTASDLRAGLTSLLQEHVYLAGITTGVALAGGDYKVPAAVLDQNSQALATAIGGVYGDAAGTQFLELWRTHIGFFVDYTVGRSTGDAAKVDKARSDLDGYRNDFGAFLAAANPHLTKEAVAGELKTHVDSLFAAIDAQAAKSPDAIAKLASAASHMPMTAGVLAGAIATQFPDKFGK